MQWVRVWHGGCFMVGMATPIEVLAKYMRTTVPICESVLEVEFRELRAALARWKASVHPANTVTDRHLCTWKANRGDKSGAMIWHPKAGMAWLELAREATKAI